MMRADPIEVLMHPALIGTFEDWLDGRGLELVRLPDDAQSEDGLELFMVSPTEETWRRMR
jgi:hypothetical protein